MERNFLWMLVAAAVLPSSACRQAPRPPAAVRELPTAALSTASLIPRHPGERPAAASGRSPLGLETEGEDYQQAAPAAADAYREEPATLDRRQAEIVRVALEVGPPPAPGVPPADDEAGAESFPLPQPSSMSLAQFESIALQSNPSIHQASAVARKAMGTRLQVGLCPNPTLGYMGQEIGDDGTYGQQGVFVSQTVVRGNKLELNQRVADQEVQALLWQVEAQRQRVLTDVRRQFYETLGAQERVALLTELESIALEAAENSRILVENQQGAPPDQLQAETQLNEVLILRRQAEFEFQAGWRQLANLVGRPQLQTGRIDGVLEAPTTERDWDSTVRQVVSGNPALLRAYAEAQRARRKIDRAAAQPIPNLEIQAAVMHMAASDDVGANLQVGLPIPLFNRNQGNVDASWCEYHRAQWNAERVRLSLESELAAAFGDYQQAANRAAIYRDEILPRQRESLDLIQLGYPAQFDFLRLFTARRSYYDARIQYLNALVDLRQAEALVDGLLLTGGLSTPDDTMLDDSLRGAALSGQ